MGRGASTRVENLYIADVEGISIEVAGTFLGREVVALGHVDPPLGLDAWGLLVDDGEVELEKSVILGHWDGQFVALGESSTHIVDSITGARTEMGELFGGMGIVAADGAQVSVERVILESNLTAGIFVSGQGTLLMLEHGIILNTDAEDEFNIGGGIEVTEEGAVRARWVYIYESQGPGIWVDAGGELVADDVAISGNRGLDGDGYGLSIHTGARVELNRVFIIDVEEVAIAVTDVDTFCSLSDVRVRDVEPVWADSFFGAGLYAAHQARVEGARLDILGTWAVGVLAVDGAIAELEDLSIEEVFPDLVGGWGGHALFVGGAANVSIDRFEVERASNVGLMLFDPETQVTLRNASIRHTSDFCPGCEEKIGGVGAGVYNGAHLDIESFELSHNSLCAVQVAYGGIDEVTPYDLHGEVDLRHGLIASNPIGINVQAEGYDHDRLTRDVIFLDNDRNLDTGIIPIPSVPDIDELFP